LAIQAKPRLIEMLGQGSDTGIAAEKKTQLERAQAEAELAHRESKTGFPLLHAHTLVGVWGAFEAAIEDTVVNVLMSQPDLLRNEVFAKVRIPLAEFETLDKEERIRRLIDELERGPSLGKRQGVYAFEMLLVPVKLASDTNPDPKKTIWEMYHVRNVIVHRGFIADKKLVEACPWLGLKVGDPITVTHESFMRYGDALREYGSTIIRRLGKRCDADVDKRMRDAVEKKKVVGLEYSYPTE
jgi:hypothetical protein